MTSGSADQEARAQGEHGAGAAEEIGSRAWITTRSPTMGLLLSGILALLGGGLLVSVVGVSPIDAYQALWQGAFGNPQALGETLIRFIPLATIGLTAIPSLKAHLFPIGAQGQLAMGALAAGLVAIAHPFAGPITIVASALAAILGGCAWISIPALLRAYLRVNETLSTLAFNFIGASLLTYLLNGPVKGPGTYLPQTKLSPPDTWLPLFMSDTRANVGILVVLVLAFGIASLDRTTLGYRVRLFGANPSLAREAGVRPPRIIIFTLLLAGAGAGLAGWMQVAGVDHAVYTSVALDYGFTGLLVAVLGGLRISGTLVAALFFAALSSGGDFMQISAGVSSQLIATIQGIAIIVAAAGLFRRYFG